MSPLASTRQMYEFIQRLHSSDRVLLVGDTRQHEAVEAGWPFAQLQEAGMKTVKLGQILRQRDPELKEAVEQLARGDVRRAMASLDVQGRDAFIFPSRDGGFVDSSNFRHRVLLKLERELGLPKLTFQVIRRTTATLAQKMGTVKDVQGLLRHSRTATTTDVYMQEIPEGVRATVDLIHRELKSEGPSLPRKSARGVSIQARKTISISAGKAEVRENSGSVVGKGVETEFGAETSASREKSFRDLLPNATNQTVNKTVSC
jgi:AAA domain-containing protein